MRYLKNMKNQIQKSLLQGIKELHIKILQSNNLPEIGNYLQEILDKVIPVLPAYSEKLKGDHVKHVSKSRIIDMMTSDIRSILDGTYGRAEIAKYKASIDIAWLKKLFTEPLAQ
jgi:hypothetical protein